LPTIPKPQYPIPNPKAPIPVKKIKNIFIE